MSALIFAHKVAIASPADVVRERGVARDTVLGWNDEHTDITRVILRPVLWERNATPELGDRPQAIINRRLLAEADILVAIFWTRLGTPTGKAESGTLEEIEEFCDSGKPTLLYFSRRAVRPDGLDTEQWSRLRAVEAKYNGRGLVSYFRTES